MLFRINAALSLENARRASNKKPKLLKKELALMLYPKASNPQVSMNYLSNKRPERISLDHIQIITEVLQVDTNFLFGMPSTYDKEFDKKVLNI